MKHWKQGFIGVLVIFALSLAFTACGDKDDGGGDTVTAFGKTAKVINSGGVSDADFATAIGILQNVLNWIEDGPLDPEEVTSMNNMMKRDITITTGNVAPENVGGALRVGVDWLKGKTISLIGNTILGINFAMLITPSYIARANSGNQRLSRQCGVPDIRFCNIG